VVNDLSSAHDDGIERLFTGMVTLARRMHTTGQRWTQGASELTTAEAAIMRIVAREGSCRPGAVAAQLGVGPSAVSRQLTALCERGLVERHPDPVDGRAELIGLTDLGRFTMSERRAAYLERLRCRFADWELSRLEAATELLDELSLLLATEPPEPPLPATPPTQDIVDARTGTRTHDTKDRA
jgi:DNA-binding MarR family transcriptional regulator